MTEVDEDHWRLRRIGDLCHEITVGFVGSQSPHFEDSGVPLLRGQNVRAGRLDLDDTKFISQETHAKWRKSALYAGDVVIVRVGYPGVASVVPHGLGEINSASVVIARPNPEVLDSHFLSYLLNSPYGRAATSARFVGSAQQVLNVGAVGDLEAVFPPIKIQKEAVGILRLLDGLIELNQRRIEILEETARLLYREWFVNFRYPGHEDVPLVDSELGPIPQGWDLIRLDEACVFNSGKTIKAEDRESGPVPVYGANGIYGWTETPIHPPCAVMGKIGSCGALNRSSVSCWVSNNSFCVTPGLFEFDSVVWFALTQIDFSRFVGGSANPYMPLEYFGHLKLPLPSPETLEAFEVLIGPVQKIQDRLVDSTEVLSKTRDLLLPRLVSGDLDVSDLDLEMVG